MLWYKNFRRSFRKRALKKLIPFVGICACILLILLGMQTPHVASMVEGALLEVIGASISLWQQTEQAFNDFMRSFDANKTQHQLAALQKENQLLRQKILYLSSVSLENKALQSVLQMVKPLGNQKFCTASLITKANPVGNLMFLISAGSQNGIRKNQPVVSGQYIVGRIDAVSPHFSRVMPACHQDFRIPVIGLKTRTQGMIAGNGTAHPNLTYIRDDQLPQTEEIFVSSPEGGAFPSHLLVGKTLADHQKRSIQLFVHWKTLENVQVLLSYPRKIPLSLRSLTPESDQ